MDEGEEIQPQDVTELRAGAKPIETTQVTLYTMQVKGEPKPSKEVLYEIVTLEGRAARIRTILDLSNIGWTLKRAPVELIKDGKTPVKKKVILIVNKETQDLLNVKFYNEFGEEYLRMVANEKGGVDLYSLKMGN